MTKKKEKCNLQCLNDEPCAIPEKKSPCVAKTHLCDSDGGRCCTFSKWVGLQDKLYPNEEGVLVMQALLNIKAKVSDPMEKKFTQLPYLKFKKLQSAISFCPFCGERLVKNGG